MNVKAMRYIQQQREHFAHICNANWSAHHIFLIYLCTHSTSYKQSPYEPVH